MDASASAAEPFGGLRGGQPGQVYRSRDGHEVTLAHRDTELGLWDVGDGKVMLSSAWSMLGYRRVDDTSPAG